MTDLPFAVALLNAMFPEDPKRNWKEFSECVDPDHILALPNILEIEQSLASTFSRPTEVSYKSLESLLLTKSQLKDFCLAAITNYFGQVAK